MPRFDYNPVPYRELKVTSESVGYEVLDPSGALVYAYVAGISKQGGTVSHQHRVDCRGQLEWNWLGSEASAGQDPLFSSPETIPHGGKGKCILLLIESPYETPRPGASLGFSNEPWHGHYFFSGSVKGSYKKLAGTRQLGYSATYPEQQHIHFLPASENYIREIPDEQRARFHELVDKKLMGSISSGELSELEALDSALRSIEEQDPEERLLRDEWSKRLDHAISSLRDINRQLEILIASGK
jgi:hypothetical protein